ncbi:MAG: SIS domain-containing protein [Saprospiraceae bacterium]|nr:SIS domain-containing protein [Saprospiraceae bacterium]
MANFLGISEDELTRIGGIHTAREICSQPDLWKEVYDLTISKRSQIEQFWNSVSTIENLQIILTGAGSSAFIGDILEGVWREYTGIATRAIATTSLVTHPHRYFSSDQPLLLVSFARSGSSPESKATIDLANQVCREVYHMVITCNPLGELAKMQYSDSDLILILPERSNDKGLAMTSSFTSMALAGYLVARTNDVFLLRDQISLLVAYAEKLIADFTEPLRTVSKLKFSRAVFLGSGPMLGAAHESHLKLQELCDGQVTCSFDSYLALRHGPKAVINNESLIVFLLSNDPYVQLYERDLVQSNMKEGRGLHRVGVIEQARGDEAVDTLLELQPLEGTSSLNEDLLSIVYVLLAQILGFFKSIDLGLKPDLPSVNGSIARVVEGVKLYPYIGHEDDARIRS